MASFRRHFTRHIHIYVQLEAISFEMLYVCVCSQAQIVTMQHNGEVQKCLQAMDLDKSTEAAQLALTVAATSISAVASRKGGSKLQEWQSLQLIQIDDKSEQTFVSRLLKGPVVELKGFCYPASQGRVGDVTAQVRFTLAGQSGQKRGSKLLPCSWLFRRFASASALR